jgi:hypothetical protein
LTLRLSEIPTTFLDPSARGVDNVLQACATVAASARNSLNAFATSFENAFDHQVKLGVGAGGNTANAKSNSRKLWVVTVGSQGFQFSIQQSPSYFAVKPLSNSLRSRKGVRMRLYKSGAGLEAADPRDLASVELDTFARQFLTAVDLFLTAPYAVPANERKAARVAQVIACKKRLAKLISENVANLLQNPVGASNLKKAQ